MISVVLKLGVFQLLNEFNWTIKMSESINKAQPPKFVVKQCRGNTDVKKPKNIFLDEQSAEISAQNTTMYSIVGDTDFKQKFYSTRHQLSESSNSELTLNQNKMQCFSNFAMSIEKGSMSSKLSKARQMEMTKDRRNLMKAYENRQKDRKVELFLNKAVKRHCSMQPQTNMTFNTIKSVYAHPNPEKESLINDNIPDYWRNSLRDNDKRLKSHVRGNHYRKQVAEEMLQTLKGRSRLEKSIPTVKPEFLVPVCSRKAKQQMRGFSINGTKVIRNMQLRNGGNSGTNPSCKYRFRPNFDFDEIHRLNYDSQHTWVTNELFS